MMRLYLSFLVPLFLFIFQNALASPAALRDSLRGHATREERRTRVPDSLVLHESHELRHTGGWVVVERAAAQAVLPMRIGLTQSNLEKGHELLMEISHPRSPSYGKRLSPSEVVELFAPSPDGAAAVIAWLIGEGVPAEKISRSVNRQWIQFDMTTKEAERLFFTEFHVYEHENSGVQNIACSGYHVPIEIRDHIDYLLPGIRLLADGFPNAAKRRSTTTWQKSSSAGYQSDTAYVEQDPIDEWLITGYQVTGGCDIEVTASCIQSQYGIPNGTTATPGNELGVFQSLGNHYFQDDLDSYFDNIAPWVPLRTAPILDGIDGATGATDEVQDAALEANLDFQLAIPLIWPQQTTLFQTDDAWYEQDLSDLNGTYKGLFNTFFDAIDGSYCSFTDYGETGDCTETSCRDPVYPDSQKGGYDGPLMCGNFTPTNVISISYSSVEYTLPVSYMKRQCAEIMKLALQGITVVESSGDNGVGGPSSQSTTGCLGESGSIFSPRSLSSCPYVLCVGATVLVNSSTVAGHMNNTYPGLIFTSASPSTSHFSTATSTQSSSPIVTPSPTVSSESPLQILQSEYPGLIISDIPSGLLSLLEAQATNAQANAHTNTSIAATVAPITSTTSIAATAEPTTLNPSGNTSPGSSTGLFEVAPSAFASGGGFSNVFARPAYQDTQVANYLTATNLWTRGYNISEDTQTSSNDTSDVSGVPAGQYFNLQGRGYPDVSAVGDNIRIFLQALPVKAGGTSAAVPIWASILTLINEERLAAGKTTVGFVHPVLYEHPEVFTDVTIGSNPGCGTTGFPSMAGWDPVTGLGSPIFPKLLELFMSLP